MHVDKWLSVATSERVKTFRLHNCRRKQMSCRNTGAVEVGFKNLGFCFFSKPKISKVRILGFLDF